MKILHIIPSYKPAFIYGGPIVSVSQLCEHLTKQGCEVTVLTTTANGMKELEIKTGWPTPVDGVKVYYFKRLTKDHTHFSPGLLLFLWKNRKNYDIIHINSWWNLVSLMSVFICWLGGTKPVLAPRGMLSLYSFKNEKTALKKLVHQLFGKFLLKQTVLHATSTIEWKDCLSINPHWKGFILPNIILLPDQKTNFTKKPSSDILQLIFLSRIHPKKGLEMLLEALAYCEFPYHLNIYGEGEPSYIKTLKTQAKKLKINQHISWKGWISGPAKLTALAHADVFILPSFNENFANVVLESLAVGTPALVSDKVGLYDYVSKKGYGWITNQTMDDLIINLKKAYNQYRNIYIDSYKVIQEFSGTSLAKAYIQEYQKILYEPEIYHYHSHV